DGLAYADGHAVARETARGDQRFRLDRGEGALAGGHRAVVGQGLPAQGVGAVVAQFGDHRVHVLAGVELPTGQLATLRRVQADGDQVAPVRPDPDLAQRVDVGRPVGRLGG